MQESICQVLPGLLDEASCKNWIARLEQGGFEQMKGDYPPSYRDNDRLVLDDPDLAARLYASLRSSLPQVLERGARRWTLSGLNPRFRSCRYREGQAFTRHRDGAHSENGRRSWLTLMLYLNDSEEFQGGGTRFYPDRFGEADRCVRPKAGMGILFDHSLWHDGEAVTSGTKYVLRTDVLYECTEVGQNAHTGYVFDLVELPGGRVASASRDKTVRVWSQGKVQAVLRHHRNSVTTLCARGAELWSGSRDREIAIWAKDLKLRAHFVAGEGTVLSLLPLKNGLVASTGGGGEVIIWDAGGRRREHFSCGHWPWAIVQLGRGELLVGDDDGSIRAVAPGRKPELRMKASASVGCLLEVDGVMLAGGGDGKLYRWQRHGHPLQPWTGHRGPITSLARLPDGRILSGSEDDGVRVWEADGSSRELLRHHDFVRALCLVEEGRRVASGSYDGSVRWTSIPVPVGIR